MSDRRRGAFSTKFVAYLAAFVVHAVIISLMIFNFSSDREVVQAIDAEKLAPIVASAVDEQKVKEQLDKIKEQDRKREREKQQQEDELKRLKEQEEQKKQDLEDLEKKNQEEQQKAQELEAERKRIALEREKEKKKAEEERKKREAEAKKERERLARLKREREEEERKRAEAQKLFEQQLAEEAKREAERKALERTTTIKNRYSKLIEDAVRKVFRGSPSYQPWLKVKFNISLDEGGNVQSLRLSNSSGNSQFDRAAETAIRLASPLPLPPKEEYPQAHRELRNLNFNFTP
ncbi:MAG: TonB family protein [Pseudomonadota bacterium]